MPSCVSRAWERRIPMQWTDEQQLVINSRGRNILVAAAAGSGKTAVLVERILTLVTDTEQPVDIDRLLVVTFTRAAAAQMRERIRASLEKRLDEAPEDALLSRQLTLLPNARITTIDGFCSYVLRSYGASIGLEAGFRVAEEGEMKLMREDILRRLFEEEHEEGRSSYIDFIETFAPGRSAAVPGELIQKVYDAAYAGPDPENWLMGAVSTPEDTRWENADRIPWMREYFEDIRVLISRGFELASRNAAMTDAPEGPSAYRPAAQQDLALFQSLHSAGDSYSDLRGILTSFSPVRLSGAKPKPDEDASYRERFKETRENIKKIRDSLLKNYLPYDAETMLGGQRDSLPVLKELIHLVRRFRELFSSAKREKNLLDYNDLEQYALRVLTDRDGRPTQAALELRDRFAHVMIDEYQDSNYLQEAVLTAVSRMDRGDNNYFMVGDVKQSIYRFRQARPDLFMEKYDRGSTGTDQRIDLHANFRSRKEIISSVNRIFRQIMRREIGGIDYDDDAALVYGAGGLYSGPAAKLCGKDAFSDKTDYRTECMLVYPPSSDDDSPSSARTAMETEAWAISDRILSLTRNTYLRDKDNGTDRLTEYRDIVILLRSMGSFAEILQDVLLIRGIPVCLTRKTGYYTAQEVQAVLQYLAILDNPRQDIPLAAVLRSPFMRLGAEDLARIRAFADRYGGMERALFLDCVRLYASEGDDISLKECLAGFLTRLNEYRDAARHLPIHELIFRLISETGFSDYVRALPGGPVRSANLEMLVTIAAEYEKTSYAGLYHFIRYVGQLRKYDIDTGEASPVGEGENAVRIMTIHASKGLEFPVVILGQMHKQFNLQDLNRTVLIHPTCGIASDYLRLEDRVRIKTPAKQAIRRRLVRDTVGEELRILYVAMTRAEQKLILTGVLKDEEALEKKKQYLGDAEAFLPETVLENAMSFSDFVLPAALRAGADDCLLFTKVYGSEILREVSEKNAEEVRLFRTMQNIDPETPYDEALHDLLAERFAFHYPYEGLDRMPAKISVSELKAARFHDEEAFRVYEEPPVIPLIPDFMKETQESITGAGRGTVYHKFMERMDYNAVSGSVPSDASADRSAEQIQSEIRRLISEHRLTQEEADVIRITDIERFLSSSVGHRMAAAAARGQLRRETPFTYAVPADTIDPAFPSSESILVQGVIDAWFPEDGGIILVDYKTDHVSSGRGEELAEKYRTQLLMYADALHRLTGEPVTGKFIYSFYLGEEIPV